MKRSAFVLNFEQENYLLVKVAEIMTTEEPTDLHRMVYEVIENWLPIYNPDVIMEWLSTEGLPDPIEFEHVDDDYLYSIKGMSIIGRMRLALEFAASDFLHLFDGLEDESLTEYLESVNAELAERAQARADRAEKEKQNA